MVRDWQDFDEEQIGIAITPEAGRVRKRFALVAYAGTLAVQRNILPWTIGRLSGWYDAYAGWMNSSDGRNDADRGIENIVEFLLEHGDSQDSNAHKALE